MKEIEQLELKAYRAEMTMDLEELFNKYRRIFCWDIPDIDQKSTDKLILAAMHAVLDEIPAKLAK